MHFKFWFICGIVLLFTGCNKDNDLILGDDRPPVIEVNNDDGTYSIKIGRTLTIEPEYKFVKDALYSWTIDGKMVSTKPNFEYAWEEAGEYFVKLLVDTEYGHAEDEFKVEVVELQKPIIDIYLPAKGLKVQKGKPYELAPTYKYSDLSEFKVNWSLDGKTVSTDNCYTFKEDKIGVYRIKIEASNEDGTSEREFDIDVVENMPYLVSFPTPSYAYTNTTRYTFSGRPVFLRPLLEYFDNPQFKWSVNGKEETSEASRTFKFTPDSPGEYNVSVTVSEKANDVSVEASVKVICVTASEQSQYKAANGSSSELFNQVFEYTPAPGQFINETNTGGFNGNEVTNEAAAKYAYNRMKANCYVSLGSFGGSIIVGFDHSIKAGSGEYDFAIQGNAFDSSNEPGIVWVMQDVNGNGLPDDEWYELKGSETGKGTTIQYYEVTYFKPPAPKMDVYWSDNLGNSGSVDFNSYHQQNYYYPLWIADDSYTLYGTRLHPRNSQSSATGFWTNAPYDWGYADNWGADVLGGDSYDGSGQMNGFKISNAIFPDGVPAKLQYIDFIKVQCGVLAKSGILGEISTEVFNFRDLTIN